MYSRSRPFLPLAAIAIATGVCLSLAGCSGRNVAGAVGAMNDANIKRLANLYTAYQKQHAWLGPKDEAAFKSFITSEMPEEKLKLMGVDPAAVDEYFVSDRDGQPFKVKYAVKGGFRVVAPVVFEQQGVEGKRQVGFTNSVKVEAVDAARYDELWKEAAPAAAPLPAEA